MQDKKRYRALQELSSAHISSPASKLTESHARHFTQDLTTFGRITTLRLELVLGGTCDISPKRVTQIAHSKRKVVFKIVVNQTYTITDSVRRVLARPELNVLEG